MEHSVHLGASHFVNGVSPTSNSKISEKSKMLLIEGKRMTVVMATMEMITMEMITMTMTVLIQEML